MPYVLCTHNPGRSLADYRAVSDRLGDGPRDGCLASMAGEADGALHTIDVWDSKAHADRFAAERLYPAMREAGIGPGGDATYVGFETDDVQLTGAPT